MKIAPQNKERFERKFSKSSADDCWLWNAGLDKDGYGQFMVSSDINRRAHRVSYALYKGELPDNILVLHNCDTPACVNPHHLFLGTTLDNIQDRCAKGRTAINSGELCKNNKVKESDIAIIRYMAQWGIRLTKIAKIYGLHQSNISRIVSGETWKHLPL